MHPRLKFQYEQWKVSLKILPQIFPQILKNEIYQYFSPVQ